MRERERVEQNKWVEFTSLQHFHFTFALQTDINNGLNDLPASLGTATTTSKLSTALSTESSKTDYLEQFELSCKKIALRRKKNTGKFRKGYIQFGLKQEKPMDKR